MDADEAIAGPTTDYSGSKILENQESRNSKMNELLSGRNKMASSSSTGIDKRNVSPGKNGFGISVGYSPGEVHDQVHSLKKAKPYVNQFNRDEDVLVTGQMKKGEP